MRRFRNLKIASLIQEELGKMFLKDFDFGDALVTITDVRIGEDLEAANVKLSVIPFEKGPEMFMLIDSRRRELQYKLLRRLNIKPMPQIRFEIEEIIDGK